MITVFALVSQNYVDVFYEGLFLSLEEVIEAIKNNIHEFTDNPDKTLELTKMNDELIGFGMALEPKCGFVYRHKNDCYFVYQYELDSVEAKKEVCPGNDNSRPTGWVCNRCNSSFCPSYGKSK